MSIRPASRPTTIQREAAQTNGVASLHRLVNKFASHDGPIWDSKTGRRSGFPHRHAQSVIFLKRLNTLWHWDVEYSQMGAGSVLNGNKAGQQGDTALASCRFVE